MARAREVVPEASRVGLITGWRCWTVLRPEGLLRPIWRRGLVWTPGRPYEAFCADDETEFPQRPPVHPVPDPACKCGVWAVCHPMLLEEVEWTWETDEVLVVGQVALWGSVIEFQRGWRAQFAYPAHLYVFTDDELLALTLRERYAVPVAWGSEARLLARLLPPKLRLTMSAPSVATATDGDSLVEEMPRIPSPLSGIAEMVRDQEVTRLEQLREDLRREQQRLEEEREALGLSRQTYRLERQRRALELRQLRAAAHQERKLLVLERAEPPTRGAPPAGAARLPSPRAELRERLAALGITLRQVADAAGCGYTNVSHVLAGRAVSAPVVGAAEALIARAEERDATMPRDPAATAEERACGERGLGAGHPGLAAKLYGLGIRQEQVARLIGCSRSTVANVLAGRSAARRGMAAMVAQTARRLVTEAEGASGEHPPVDDAAAPVPNLGAPPALRGELLRERAELNALLRRLVTERAASDTARRDVERARQQLSTERKKLDRTRDTFTLRQAAMGLRRRLDGAGISKTRLARAAKVDLSGVSRVLAGYITSAHVVAVAERLLARARKKKKIR